MAMGELLREMELLKGLTEKEFNLLADGLAAVTVEAGQTVLQGGDASKSDQLWLVLDGQAAATLPDNENYSDVFERGQYFGELSLTLRPSLHTVTAVGELHLLQLSRDGLKQMPGASAKKLAKVLGASKGAQLKRHELSLGRAATKAVMSVSSLLDTLTAKERDRIADEVERVELAAGDVLLESGAEGDEVWFIEDGRVGSTDDSSDWVGPPAALVEDSLLRTIVHPVTVTARSEAVRCFKLHRRTFERLVGCDCETALKRDPVAYQRRMLKQSFDSFDIDGSGTIDTDEVKQAMAQQGVEMTTEEVDELFAQVDDDGSGEIDFDEFVLLMSMTEGDEEQETAEVPGAGGAAGDGAEGDGDEAASGDDSGQARPPSRGKGLFATFKKTVAAAAMENATELTLKEVIEMLQSKRPNQRSEFDLQRLLEKLEPLRFFQKLPEVEKSDLRLQICRHLGVSVWGKGKPIVKEGEIGTEFYIIIAGQASVRDKDGSIERVLKEGVGFGEMALVGEALEDRVQMRTVMADADPETVAVTLLRDDYLSLIRAFEERMLASTMAFLQSTHYFKRLSPTALTWIAQVLEPATWQRGELLAEQGKRPTHILLMDSGEARLSVTLKGDANGMRLKTSKPMVVDVALISLDGEVVCESALFDDSGNLGNYYATAPCEGYRIHKREARKLMRGSTMPLFRECQAQRQEFVRNRLEFCATLRPTGGTGAGGGTHGGGEERPGGGGGDISLTTRGAASFSGEAEISRIGLGALSTAALQRRHRLEKASTSLRSDLTATAVGGRRRRSASIRSGGYGISSGGGSGSKRSGPGGRRRRSGGSVSSLNMSMSSIGDGDGSELSWSTASLRQYEQRNGGGAMHSSGSGTGDSSNRRRTTSHRRHGAATTTMSTFGKGSTGQPAPSMLVRSLGTHSSHAASLFHQVDGPGAAAGSFGATTGAASMIRGDRSRTSANASHRDKSAADSTRSRTGASRSRKAAEPSVFGTFSLDAFQPPRLQRAWT